MTGRTYLRNAVDVALNGAIDQTATFIVVDDATDLPDNVPFYIVIDPFNDAGREYVRVGAIDKGTNTLSSLDRNLEGTQSLVHPDAAIVRLSWQSQHLDDAWEDQVGITSRGRWRGTWVEGTYEKNDMVIDGGFLAIANKQTTDPAAPVAIGQPTYLIPDAPTWIPRSHTDYVLTGLRVTVPVDELFQVTAVRAWIPSISSDFTYTAFIEDATNGVTQQLFSIRGDTLDAPGWFTFTIDPAFVSPGDDFVVWLLTQNTAASTTFNHAWVRGVNSNQDIDPGLGNWNTNTQLNVLRISSTDDDGTPRTAELSNVTPGSFIKPSDEADLTAFYDFRVTSNLGDQGGWYLFFVEPIDTGVGGPPTIGFRQQLYFEIPVAAPVDYVELTDYYLPNPALSGLLQLGSGAPVANQNAYGIDLLLQEFVASDDWDLMSTSGSSTGGSGSPGLTEPQADALYLRLDAGNSPVTGKPTFAAGLELGANLEAGGFRLTGLAVPPTADAEAAAKKYVDDQDTAHDVAPDPHPQYLTPAEADAGYLKLDASNDPITGALDITGQLTVFDNKILIHDSDLNFFLDTKFQANIQLAGQNRLSFQQSNQRLRFIGQTGTVIGHLYDDKTNDLPGSLLGAYYFTAAVNMLSSGNTVVFTTNIDTASLFPGGAADVPELLVVTNGFIRQNNQGATAHQARTEIAGTGRNYGYGGGSANADLNRTSAPMPNSVRVTAGAASVQVDVSARSFGSDISGTMDLHVWVYAAPIGGNV